MNEQIRYALEHDRTIDITTIGRKTNQPHRIEIWFHNLDGRLYITGTPGQRSWYANLVAHPDFTLHLKGSTRVDLLARATPITDPLQRRTILAGILRKLGEQHDLDAWVAGSPLVEVQLQAPA